MASVPTLESLSALQAAVVLCNGATMKKEIFRLPGSVYDTKRTEQEFEIEKRQWKDTIKAKSEDIIKNMPLGLQEILAVYILPVARGMSRWGQYLKYNINLGPTYFAHFLNEHLFTAKGRIDRKRAAEAMARDERLDVCQRFKIACLCMLTKDVEELWKQMTVYQRENFYDVDDPEHLQQPELAKMWSYYFLGKINQLLQTTSGENAKDIFWRRAVKNAVDVGSDVAVRNCWQRLDGRTRNELVVEMISKVLQEVQNRKKVKGTYQKNYLIENFADILCFLLMQVTDRQLTVVLRRSLESDGHLVWEFLMDWDGDAFLKVLGCTWAVWNETDFSSFFSKMCDKISSQNYLFKSRQHITSCDYRRLLRDFWTLSPDPFKRYAFKNEMLFRFTISDLDEDTVAFIFKDATHDEKTYIIFSDDEHSGLFKTAFEDNDQKVAKCLFQCVDLSPNEKRRRLKAELEDFMSDLFYDDEMFEDKMLVFFAFVDYCLQYEDEASKTDYKRRIAQEKGKDICAKLIAIDKEEEVDRFLQWSFASSDEVSTFKKTCFIDGRPLKDAVMCLV